MTCPPGEDTDDTARWWRAYTLAENDQVDELRQLAAAGDDHARRQLATWLSDRAFAGGLSDREKVEEAIDVIRPLAAAGDDVAELWLARWLVDCGRLDELRERADAGSRHAGRLLASRLAGHDLLDELRQRADGGSYDAWRELIKKLADRDMHEELRELTEAADADRLQLIFAAVDEAGSDSIGVLRLLADLGDETSSMRLAHRLAREGALSELRQRAADGDAHAGYWLAECPTRGSGGERDRQ